MKRIMIALLIVCMSFSFCFAAEPSASADISIIYTGDIHGDVTSGLSLSGVKAYGNGVKDEGNYVEYVDLGDTLSGSSYASISKGDFTILAMNLVGFGVSVPSAAEFDFGISKFSYISNFESGHTYVSCNFRNAEGKTVLKPYTIKTYGRTKVGYIGISDPETKELSQESFEDASGKELYSFKEENLKTASETNLFTTVQESIDAAKAEGAEYIVVLGHISESGSYAYNPKKIIENTTGINCFINGKTHSQIAALEVKDKAGNSVLLTNPGGGIKNIGVLTIKPSEKSISTQLISSYKYRDIATKDGIEKLQDEYASELNTKFSETSYKLEANNSSGVRIVESQETNMGDLVSDAYKYVSGADVAFSQANEIVSNIPIGPISYFDVMATLPKGDGISVVKVSGLDIVDAIEMSSRLYPSKNENFLQVSGLTYDIQETIIPTVELDGQGNFVTVSGDYRVTNVKINGQDIDLLGTYTVCGANSLLDGKTGYTMFAAAPAVKLNCTTDNQAMISYLESMGSIISPNYQNVQKRIDSIKLARQSEIDQEVQAKLDSTLANYRNEIDELRAQLEIKEKALAVKCMTIKASTKFTKVNGKRKVKFSWTPSANIEGVKYQVYRSTKKSSGFIKKKTTSLKYYNNTTELTKGKTYYYKVRAYIYIGGKYYYSGWSTVKSATITK